MLADGYGVDPCPEPGVVGDDSDDCGASGLPSGVLSRRACLVVSEFAGELLISGTLERMQGGRSQSQTDSVLQCIAR